MPTSHDSRDTSDDDAAVTGPGAAASSPTDALAPFRPRRGRFVAQCAMWGSLVVFGAIALIIPAQVGGLWGVADRVMFFALGVVIAMLAWRYTVISATPSREHLVVRNLIVSRTVQWSQIVGIQFGGGEPWVTLDLDDSDTLAVMAIQKADGPAAQQQASRLAALVQAFGETSGPGDSSDSSDGSDSTGSSDTGTRPEPPPEGARP